MIWYSDLLQNKTYTGLEINYLCSDSDLLKNKTYTGLEINYLCFDTVICYRIKHTLA